MRRRFLFFAVIFVAMFFAQRAFAQSQTTVAATVTDPNGIPYAGGTVKATLAPPGVSSPCVVVNSNCVPIPGTVGPATLDSTGSFTMNLFPNASITPAATQWTFTVCIAPGVPPPFGTGPQCFSATTTIAGASQSLSSTLSALAPALARSSLPVPASPSTALLAPQQGLVQSNFTNNGTSGAIPAVAMIQNVVAGDLLLACELGHINAAATIGVTDTQVNTWTALPFAGTTGAGGTSEIQCFSAIAASSAADSMQITMSGPTVFDLNLIFAEYAGVTTLDQKISASATASGNITTTKPNELLITFAVTANTGTGVLPLVIAPGGTQSQRIAIQNTDTAETPVAALLEDSTAPVAGTYSASFNQGGTATNPTIQLLSFYSSAALTSTTRLLAWSDLPPQPLNITCSLTFVPCATFQLTSGGGAKMVTYGVATFRSVSNANNSICISMPLGCVTIPVINAADDDFLWSVSNGGPSTTCSFGARMDGDGFYVLGGVPAPNLNCSLALVEPNITAFGGFRITDNQDTTHPDLDVGPSPAKTAGALVARMQDSAGTIFFSAPDIESAQTVTPSFPIGVADGALTSGKCVQAGTGGLLTNATGGCGIGVAIQSNAVVTLSADVALTSGTPATILTKSVTMPASGCPCRVLVSYGIYATTNNQTFNAWVSDATNAMAGSQTTGTGTNTTGLSASQTSPVTYANNAVVVFTLTAEDNGVGGTIKAAPIQGSGGNSWMSVSVLPSN